MFPAVYRLHVQGSLANYRSDWFAGLDIEGDGQGGTYLWGTVRDLSELYGLLDRGRDLGLVLLGVERLEVATSQEN